MTFDDLKFEPHPYCIKHPKAGDGVKATVDFDNGYGASVIRFPLSYGYEQGLYELAVFYKDDLCYDSGITDDVLGWLTPEDVTKYLQMIEALPAKQKKQNTEENLR